MNRRSVGFFVFAIVLASSITASSTAGAPDLKKIKCPISGRPVKATATAELDDYTVYFCCGNCVKAFKKDNAKFTAKAFHQVVATNQAEQGTCPKSGKGLNPGVALDVNGVSVSFCCKRCKGWAVKLAGDARIQKIFNRAAFKKHFSKVEK
ncbi:MAG: hypothetical protein CMJ81_00335 [Planctomycetaceae bacterium]|mgnify:CR=1 FL=1|nr:hypothetical protein [Planctomycetaceae bacterium]MBP63303.1 hypothetical protein [Planctomycetaceae bacterium]